MISRKIDRHLPVRQGAAIEFLQITKHPRLLRRIVNFQTGLTFHLTDLHGYLRSLIEQPDNFPVFFSHFFSQFIQRRLHAFISSRTL